MAQKVKKETKVDIDKLTKKQAEDLSKELGDKIAAIMDEANLKCNELLAKYGLETQIGYKVTKKE